MSQELLVLVLFLPVYYVSAFLHELGHVICAWLAGAVPTSFGLGTDRLFFTGSLWGIRIYLGARSPMQGLAFALFPQILPARWRLVLYVSGGILANAAIAALAFGLATRWPVATTFCYVVAWTNLFMGFLSALPLTIHSGNTVLRNDGNLILRTIFGQRELPPAEFLRSIENMSKLLRKTGDLRYLYAITVYAADKWSDLGDVARARELLDEARSLAADPPPSFQAYELLVRGSAASIAGDLESAEEIYRKAESEFYRLNHRVGLLLSTTLQVGLVLKQGNSEKIAAFAKEFEESPLLRQHWRFEKNIRQLLASCRERLDATDIEAQLIADESAASRIHLPLYRRSLFKSVAEGYCRVGRYEKAAEAYTQALEAVAALDKSFTSPDRERFQLAQTLLIREAQACFRGLGREEEAKRLDGFFSAESQRQQEEDIARTEKRRLGDRLRAGIALAMFNAAAVLISYEIHQTVETLAAFGSGQSLAWVKNPANFVFLVIWIIFLFFTVFEVAIGLPLVLLSWLLPSLRRVSATLVLLLAMIPWIFSIAFAFFETVLRFFFR